MRQALIVFFDSPEAKAEDTLGSEVTGIFSGKTGYSKSYAQGWDQIFGTKIEESKVSNKSLN